MGIEKADGILVDLGVSSFHLDDPTRGFSFSTSGPLDMRMDRSRERCAADLVNQLGQTELAHLIENFGEERYARPIARAIVTARLQSPITDTKTLADIIVAAYPARARRESAIHPATRTFQALRIAVNEELASLPGALNRAIGRLNPGGRIAVIAFHSLEDRIVKQTFADLTPHCRCLKELPICMCGSPGVVSVLTRKPIIPANDEIEKNPRARSAKLRVAQRLADPVEQGG
jgi:16S rRNA (cytosine1402-N4)-methyltransferase